MDADTYLSTISTYGVPNIGRPRKEIIKSNSFNASLWLSDSFPLKLRDQISPILDLLAVRDTKFSRLKSFVELQLPSGFPIKIKIPLFHMINAQITFKNVNEPTPNDIQIVDPSQSTELNVFTIQDSLFQIPDHFQRYETDASASLLFERFGQMENNIQILPEERCSSIDIDDEYVYFLNRFVSDSETPETSGYQREIQLAIQESLNMTSEQETDIVDVNVSNEEYGKELCKALELSLAEEERRKHEENEEEEHLKRILELSVLEKWFFSYPHTIQYLCIIRYLNVNI